MTNLPSVVTAARPFVEAAVKEAQGLIAEYEFRRDHLKEGLQAAIIEYDFERRQLYLMLWWNVGGIIRDWRNACQTELGREVPLKSFCNAVTWILGRSKESGYKAVQFREQFSEVESLKKLPFGKAISWHLIVNKVLPGLNVGKTLAEIAQEDRADMAAKKASKPATLYNGLGTLAHLHGPRGQVWSVELPTGTELKGVSAGDEVPLVIRGKL